MKFWATKTCYKYSIYIIVICSAQFSLYIGDQWNANDTEGSVSSSLIDGVLSMESSRIALALAGFVYIRNSTQTEGIRFM